MAAKEGGGGGSTAVTSHSVVGEWTHVSKSKLPGILPLANHLVLISHCSYSNQRGGRLFGSSERKMEGGGEIVQLYPERIGRYKQEE